MIVMMLVAVLVLNTALAFAGTSVSRYTQKSYNHNEKFDDRIMVNGLDASTYQNDIDWKKKLRQTELILQSFELVTGDMVQRANLIRMTIM